MGLCGFGQRLPASVLANCRPCHSERRGAQADGCGFGHRPPSPVLTKCRTCHSERHGGSSGPLTVSAIGCPPLRSRIAAPATSNALGVRAAGFGHNLPPLRSRNAAPATPNALTARADGCGFGHRLPSPNAHEVPPLPLRTHWRSKRTFGRFGHRLPPSVPTICRPCHFQRPGGSGSCLRFRPPSALCARDMPPLPL